MTGCVTPFRPGAPKGAIDVIAHRGASAYAPENTLAAFALAKEMNADWFELDCTLSRDGHVVVIHDDTLDRTTNGEGPVRDRTLAELKQLDAGSWKDPRFAGERLPLLVEALELARERRIGVYIEIKNAQDDSALMTDIMKMAGDRKRMTPEMKRAMHRMIENSGTRNWNLRARSSQSFANTAWPARSSSNPSRRSSAPSPATKPRASASKCWPSRTRTIRNAGRVT